jgi:hypothetical protein
MSSLALKRESTSGRGTTPRPTSTTRSPTKDHTSRGLSSKRKAECASGSGRPQNNEKYMRTTARPVSAEAATTENPSTGNASTAPLTRSSCPTNPRVPGKPVQASPMARKLTARTGIRS